MTNSEYTLDKWLLNHGLGGDPGLKLDLEELLNTKLDKYVTELVGKKCKDYEENCGVCHAWKLREEMK
jgi:hypothetical protein